MSIKKAHVSRKQFLQQLLLGVGAVGTGTFLPELVKGKNVGSLLAPTNNPQKVVIIGAGLAGLSAALELKNAGHDVTVLEARNRPGGRVSTARDPFDNDIYAEEGAVAFSGTYTVAKKYIEKYGLETFQLGLPENPVYHLNGNRFTAKSMEKWPYDLTQEEQQLGPMGIVKKYIIDTLPDEISQPKQWNEPPLARLDQKSLAEYMKSHGASNEAIQLIKDTQWFAGLPDKTSALSMAISDFGLFMGGAPFILLGGNDQLPKSMADSIKKNIQYNVQVSAIHNRPNEVLVEGKKNGNSTQFKADHVISTLPAPVLRKIEISPKLPKEQSKAVHELPYFNITRNYAQVDRAYWQDEGVSNVGFTDLLIGQVNCYPGSDPSKAAVLESFVTGPDALEVSDLSESELEKKIKSGIEQVFPGFKNHYQEVVHSKAWDKDPYALGSGSFPAPGDVTKFLNSLHQPHGRIHFAGEHTSILRSTMEGALRSGIRAAKEVNGKA